MYYRIEIWGRNGYKKYTVDTYDEAQRYKKRAEAWGEACAITFCPS